MCYVPFDHIATKARLVVVVITPGMTQAANALRPPIRPVSWDWGRKLCWGLPSAPPASAAARSEAILWPCWTGIGVARHFGIATTAEMFRPGAADVHFTSALRYPVFVDGLNYKGTPDILRSPLLRSMFVLLRREEEPSGLNRIYRLYRKEGLTVRKSAPQSPRVEGHRS